jgi:hypothetical protein
MDGTRRYLTASRYERYARELPSTRSSSLMRINWNEVLTNSRTKFSGLGFSAT